MQTSPADLRITISWLGRLEGNLFAGSLGAFAASGNTGNATPFLDFGHDGNGAWRVGIRNTAGTVLSETGGTTDHYHHVFTVVYDGSTLKYRVDGVEVINVAKTIGAISLNVFSMLGRRRNTDDGFVVGEMPFTAVWNTALSDSDISYNEKLMQQYWQWGNRVDDVKVTIVGDSQTYAFPGSQNWPEQILYQNDYPTVANLAFNGAKVSDWIESSNLALIQAQFDVTKDNLLIMMIGENDLGTDGTGGGTDASTLIANYGTLLSATAGYGFTNVINVGMPARGNPEAALYTQKRAIFNAYLESVTAPMKYINTYSIPGTPGDGIMWRTIDDIHLSEEGECFLSDLIQPAYRWAIHNQL